MGNVVLTGQQTTIKALKMAEETRGKPEGVMFLATGEPLHKYDLTQQ